MKKKKTLRISGMSCISCQNKIEKALKKAKGIESASVKYETGTAEISFDDEKISLKDMNYHSHAEYPMEMVSKQS